MERGHTPYGYRIENGEAVIAPDEAEKIRQIFSRYISGDGFIEAAKSAGLDMTHSSVKRLLKNTHYTGDEFYPAIIDKDTFDAAEAEHTKRLEVLGRPYTKTTEPKVRQVKSRFMMGPVMKRVKDPYEQAAYIYSLIESEE